MARGVAEAPAEARTRPADASRAGGVSLTAVALLLASLAAPTASACGVLVVTPSQDRVVVAPGEVFVLRVGIEKDDPDVGRASITVAAPPGWSAVASNPTPVLSGRDPLLTSVNIVAPQRGTGVTEGDVVVSVETACEGTPAVSTGGARVRVEVEPLSPALLALLAGLGILGVGALLAVGVVSRIAGVGVTSVEPERRLAPGETASFRLVVENKRTVPERITLAVGAVPEGWSVVVPAPQLDLEPREEKEVWLAVRAPVDAVAGTEADVVVHAALKDEPRRAAAIVLRARVA